MQRAAWNVVHALEVVEYPDLPPGRALTLPALCVDMGSLVGAVEQYFGKTARVTYSPVPEIERAFASYPPLHTPAALGARFLPDETLAKLVSAASSCLIDV